MKEPEVGFGFWLVCLDSYRRAPFHDGLFVVVVVVIVIL